MRNINFLSQKNHLLVMTLLQTKLILASTSTESKILNDSKKKPLNHEIQCGFVVI